MNKAFRALTLGAAFAAPTLVPQQPAQSMPVPAPSTDITNYHGTNTDIGGVPARTGYCAADGSLIYDDLLIFLEQNALKPGDSLPSITLMTELETNAIVKATKGQAKLSPAEADAAILPALKTELEKTSAGLTTIFGVPFYFRLGDHFKITPAAAACKTVPDEKEAAPALTHATPLMLKA